MVEIADKTKSIMNKHNSLLYDENGKLRKELYTISPTELDEIQAGLDLEPDKDWVLQLRERFWPQAVRNLKPGDIIYIRPEYSVAKGFGGRMTFISFGGSCNAFFCRTEDRGGGWIGPEMLVNRENPTLKPEGI